MMNQSIVHIGILLSLALGWVPRANGADFVDRATLIAREAEDLKAIAEDPGSERLLSIGAGVPGPENTALFDSALASCREALKHNPKDTKVRVNLGTLYLCHDALYPGEASTLEKAVDQFLTVLRDDPSDQMVAETFGQRAVLERLVAELPKEQAQAVEAALNHAMDRESGNLAVAAVALRLKWFSGRIADAHEMAVHLVEIFPNQGRSDALILLGAVDLAAGNTRSAIASFEKILNDDETTTTTRAQWTIAGLGLAETDRVLGRLDAAAELLDKRSKLSSPEYLDMVAYEAGFPKFSETLWKIGEAFLGEGNHAFVEKHFGVRDQVILVSQAAEDRNGEAVDLFNANRLEEAQRAAYEATRLQPLEPWYWLDAARIAFQRKRYAECVSDFRRARALPTADSGTRTDQMKNEDARKLAFSYVLMGNYSTAYKIISERLQDQRDVAWLDQWAVVICYGARGWNEAFALWQQRVRKDPTQPLEEQKRSAMDLVVGGLGDFVQMLDVQKPNYVALNLQVLIFRATGEEAWNHTMSGHRHRPAAPDRLRKETLDRICEIYRRLPLKPVVPDGAAELELQAQAALDSGNLGNCFPLYEEAIEVVPWWPDAHLALAVFALKRGDTAYANEEFRVLFSLASAGSPVEQAARKFIARLNQLPQPNNE